MYDKVAQSEFGMDYDQLGPNEKEWVRDEIDNMSMKEQLNEWDVYSEELGEGYTLSFGAIEEAEYRGRKVKLNKPMRGDVKKFKVYVKNQKGNVVKVNFGHGGTSAKRKTMRIRKGNPARRKSFRARHKCSTPGPKWKARYWSCKKW